MSEAARPPWFTFHLHSPIIPIAEAHVETLNILGKFSGKRLDNIPTIQHNNLFKRIRENFHIELFLKGGHTLFSPYYTVLRGESFPELTGFLAQNEEFLDSLKDFIVGTLFVYSAVIEENAGLPGQRAGRPHRPPALPRPRPLRGQVLLPLPGRAGERLQRQDLPRPRVRRPEEIREGTPGAPRIIPIAPGTERQNPGAGHPQTALLRRLQETLPRRSRLPGQGTQHRGPGADQADPQKRPEERSHRHPGRVHRQSADPAQPDGRAEGFHGGIRE